MKKIWNKEEKLQYERALLAQGYGYIAGVDEVGRGPLAGPVVCAAVIMPLDDASIIEGIDDSKKLSEKKREQLAEEIKKRALAYTIIEVSEQKIDEINILEATKLGMKEAIETLSFTELLLTEYPFVPFSATYPAIPPTLFALLFPLSGVETILPPST